MRHKNPEVHRRLLFALAALIVGGCQAQPLPSTPMPSATAIPLPSAPPATSGAVGPSFDGLQMFDAKNGWAWKGLSQLYGTDDGGATWHEVHLRGAMQVTGGAFLNAREAWLPGVPDAKLEQAVYRTSDGGQTWMTMAGLRGPNLALYFHDAQNGWALNGIGGAGNIFYTAYRTVDGGATWTELHTTSPGGFDQGPEAGTIHVATGDSVSFMPPNTIWLASGSGTDTPAARLTLSRDGGKTWRVLDLPLPASLTAGQQPVAAEAPQFVSDQDAYLPVTVSGRLLFFVSHDAGESWVLLPPQLPATQMDPRVQFVSSSEGFAVCGVMLCATRDGGGSWNEIATPFPFVPSGGSAFASQFDFVDAMRGWALLQKPDGSTALITTADGGQTWIDMQPRLGF